MIYRLQCQNSRTKQIKRRYILQKLVFFGKHSHTSPLVIVSTCKVKQQKMSTCFNEKIKQREQIYSQIKKNYMLRCDIVFFIPRFVAETNTC